jgi:AcrR family transcriptional regulator
MPGSAKAKRRHAGRPRGSDRRRKVRATPYHHGSLDTALLDAAERIMEEKGIQGLTLRAAAREAGVSHAAPKNHFGDLTGLLSELAARGYERFCAMMLADVRANDTAMQRMQAIGRAYVAFARAHPNMFMLMFRSERLDMKRPALRDAAHAAQRVLANAVAARRRENVEGILTQPQAAAIVAAWSLVHGFAMLLLDGRLDPVLARMQTGTTGDMLLEAILTTPQISRRAR